MRNPPGGGEGGGGRGLEVHNGAPVSRWPYYPVGASRVTAARRSGSARQIAVCSTSRGGVLGSPRQARAVLHRCGAGAARRVARHHHLPHSSSSTFSSSPQPAALAGALAAPRRALPPREAAALGLSLLPPAGAAPQLSQPSSPPPPSKPLKLELWLREWALPCWGKAGATGAERLSLRDMPPPRPLPLPKPSLPKWLPSERLLPISSVM
mmetsp:Transcript_11483/g.28933  ORF Transcript_11483/g.28933 Transcript_11483/m.28933 type:complete len:210 (+) Transcript_11483:3-632(+)